MSLLRRFGARLLRRGTAALEELPFGARVTDLLRPPPAIGVRVPHRADMPYNEVLQSDRAIAEAITELGWEHPTRPKTWDLFKAAHFVCERVPDRRASILDAGCVGSPILEILYGAGYRSLFGCDLSDRLRPRVPGLRFVHGDMTRTPYADGSFAVALCLSVIEHGVPLDLAMAEMARVLTPGGYLLLSTDYHEPKVSTADVDRRTSFGLPWNIFSRAEIEAAIVMAERHGLTPVEPMRWQSGQAAVSWWGKAYTFLFLALRKR